jgi:DNA polymerase III alpha subunit
MWDAYKKYSAISPVQYDDNLVMNSITETYNIAHNRIQKFMPDTTVRLPEFVVPAGFTAGEALKHFCMEGLRNLGFLENAQYVNQLEYELDVIEDRGFSKYFLTMKAISDKAQQLQLVGAGRGSAAGSLVSYVLGITQVDPLKHGLLFSRFMTKNQDGFPDIDYDVSDPMVLKDVLIKEWGDTTVVPISNWNTLQLKSLVKDISKFYNIPFKEVNEVTSKMMNEATPLAKKEHGMKAGVYTPTFEEVKKYSKSLQDFLVQYPHIANHINALYGQVRSCFTDKVSILTDDGHKNIKDIETGDKIAYYGEDNSIHFNDKYEIYFQGNKDVYEVELEDGTTIELTEDHKVLTQDGYKQVKELTENDMLFSVE